MKLRGGMYEDKARPGSVRAYIDTPNGTRQWRRFKSENEANAWIIDQSAEINRGSFLEPSKITVGDWTEEWLSVYVKPKVRINTYERYLLSYSHIEPLYNITLQKLEPHTAQKFFSTCKLSDNSKNKAYKLLKASLRQAVNNGFVQRNVLDTFAAPKVKKTEIQIFRPEEVVSLLTFCRDKFPRYYPLFVFLAKTGARLGEALALQWTEVDIKQQEVYIRASTEETKTKGVRVGSVKTDRSKRKIAVPASVAEALQGIRKQDGLVFSTRTGGLLLKRNVIRAWQNLFEAYNKQRKIVKIEYKSLHKLRHTHATTLLADGDIAIADVSARLGHARISHTLDLYTHARPEQDKIIAGKIDDLYEK
jgi:integrase